jgi:NADPH:quinone reductase-like Zn-dependent oxidoreductase
MDSMKAIRIHQYGNSQSLSFEEAPKPVVGPNEVLVRVHATSVNPFDSAARAGYMAGWYNFEFPLILGLDVSGVVEEVGPGVTKFKVGDEVFARTDPAKGGGYAEFVAVDLAHVVAKPKSLDHVQAAAIPHAAVTAWVALIDTAQIKPGQRVLIHGAAGGVGVIAVQLAKLYGAYVITTSSTNNLEFLRGLGADQTIDYTTSNFAEQVHDVDIVLDTVGGDTLVQSGAVIKPGGLIMSLVDPSVEGVAKQHGGRGQMVTSGMPSAQILTEIAVLVESGKLKQVVSAELPINKIQDAHDLIDTRHTRGKIVLKIIQ